MFKSWSFGARRIQTQLVVWTALIIVLSVVVISEIRMRSSVRLLQSYLQDRAESEVRTVANALNLTNVRAAALQIPVVDKRLREFVEGDPTLDRMDILQSRDGVLSVLCSSSEEAQERVSSVPETLTSEMQMFDSKQLLVTSLPIEDSDLVLVAYSTMKNIEQFQDFSRLLTPVFGITFTLVTTGMLYVMYNRILSRRFEILLSGIRRARSGEMVHIPADHADEIGLIAQTLNGLLAQVHSFNDELRREVSVATQDLNKRNIALEETTRQMVQMQQQLLQAQRLATVGQMAATFAHEIGSPMSALSVQVQLLLEDAGLNEEQRETLGIIRNQIHTVVHIVNDLLQTARRGPSDFVLTDLNETLGTVLKLVQPKLMSQHITSNVDLQPLPLVRGYPLYLQEAFLNVINNASDAMPQGGHIEVKSWYDTGSGLANIRISDTGPGIDPSVAEHIFDHFVTTKEIGRGTGLGLAIVKEIVENHRGSVRVESNNASGASGGSGTAAHITFPADARVTRAS
jgi:signal transduction histidine kinase